MSKEKAKQIVDAIWDDVHGRCGIQNAFEECDDDILKEIKADWTDEIMKILNKQDGKHDGR